MDDVVGIIYKATHRDEQIVYVGKTTKSLEIRRRQHLYDAVYGSALHFHRALRKYGEAAFDWSVIDEAATEQELNEKERYWIQFYKSTDSRFGYNLTFGGDGLHPSFKMKRSDETRKRLSASKKGEKNPTRRVDVRCRWIHNVPIYFLIEVVKSQRYMASFYLSGVKD